MFSGLTNLIAALMPQLTALFWVLAGLALIGAIIEMLFPTLLPLGFTLRRLLVAAVLLIVMPGVLQWLATQGTAKGVPL